MRRTETLWLVLVLLLFAGMSLWLVWRMSKQQEMPPPCSTYSAAPSGCLALYELLGELGFEARRFGDTEYDYPKGECVVIVLEPVPDVAKMLFGVLDAKALRLWLESGGRLVLAGAPDDPTISVALHSLIGDTDSQGPLKVPPSLVAKHEKRGQAGSEVALWHTYRPGEVFRLPSGRPALWRDVGRIETASLLAPPGQAGNGILYCKGSPSVGPAIPEPLVAYQRIGDGELFWVLKPELFTNGWINRADNHRLILAVLALAAHGGPVYFDEHVHGYQRERSNAASLLLRTTGGGLLIALGLGIVLWFLGAAIQPARAKPEGPPQRRQAAEMVLAQADLYRRAGIRPQVAESLVDGVRRAFVIATHQAVFPDNAVLGRALQTAVERGVSGVEPLLLYLRTRVVPTRQADLLRLAQACDKARAWLQQGARGIE